MREIFGTVFETHNDFTKNCVALFLRENASVRKKVDTVVAYEKSFGEIFRGKKRKLLKEMLADADVGERKMRMQVTTH